MLIKIEDKNSGGQPIRLSDLKAGDIFQHSCGNGWEPDVYLMLDPKLDEVGQVFNLSERITAWFSESSMSRYRVFSGITLNNPIEFK